jgi:hypothetical protein
MAVIIGLFIGRWHVIVNDKTEDRRQMTDGEGWRLVIYAG